MILGVNDEKQIKNEYLKKQEEFLDTFIKLRMNKSIGQRKTIQAKEMISRSHIIGVFGMSLGSTDMVWWEELVSWLCSNKNNKLIIYCRGYGEVLKRKIPSKIIRLNNKIKNDFLEKGKGNHKNDTLNEIKSRIFISYNADIFNFVKDN